MLLFDSEVDCVFVGPGLDEKVLTFIVGRYRFFRHDIPDRGFVVGEYFYERNTGDGGIGSEGPYKAEGLKVGMRLESMVAGTELGNDKIFE